MNLNRLTTNLGILLVTALLTLPAAHAEDQANAEAAKDTSGWEQSVKDAWLDGKLEATLLFNEHINSFDIDTNVKDGVAYLNGVVDSDIDRDLAEEIAKSIDGITKVENFLAVDEALAGDEVRSVAAEERKGFKEHVMDATLTARIKSKLLLNDNTGGMAVNVDSDDGTVTLSGTVESDVEKALVLKIAENADGAKTVEDQLVVKSAESTNQ